MEVVSLRQIQCLLAALTVFITARGCALSEDDGYAQRVREIATLCAMSAQDDEYARALWLHDYIINTCEYVIVDTDADAADVFMHSKGSARQYAAAYRLLLNELGILCEVVSGEAYANGEYFDHTWNIARLNGDWYHIDCASDEKTDGSAKHEYFGLNDVQMSRDRKWPENTAEAAAEPNGDACNYFLRSGYMPISDAAGLESLLAERVIAECPYIALYYVGDDRAFEIRESVFAALDKIAPGVAYEIANPNAENRTCDIMLNFGAGFPDMQKAQSVSFHNDEITLCAGDEITLPLTALPESADMGGVKLMSGDEWIANISAGTLKANAPGTVKVYAECDNSARDECTVTVYADNSLILPKGLPEVSDETYMDCDSIERVWIPNGATRIGSKAFASCAALKTVAIPNSVTYIADDAFENAVGLTIICESDGYPYEYAVINNHSVQTID